MKVRGEGFGPATSIVFRGRRGTKDDRTVKPLKTRTHKVLVRIPAAAKSGPVRAVAADAKADGPRLKVSKKTFRFGSADGPGIFPVRAKHSYGDGLGAGRGHQGQDIFASCGKPIVSALNGKVTTAKWHSAAGNFVVVESADGTNQVYMHMEAPSLVKPGRRVQAGQQLGTVGQTGRASGCHLHFELWSAPGWYEGGSVMDPVPSLKAWDRRS